MAETPAADAGTNGAAKPAGALWGAVGDEARARFFAISGHDANEKSAMNRAAQAMALGLPPEKFATVYPGTQQSSTVVNKGMGALAATMIALSAAIGGVGLGLGLPAMMKQQPVAPITQPAAPPGYELQKWDGKQWVPVPQQGT